MMSTNCYVPASAMFRIVSERLGLSGQNINFHNENFFGLKVGEFVIQIGNGKENGTIRTDLFTNPIEYVGSIICQFKEKEKMYAFKLPDVVNGSNFYLLFGKTPDEIFTEAVYSMKDRKTGETSSYVRFYKPVFVKVEKDFKPISSSNFLTELTINL